MIILAHVDPPSLLFQIRNFDVPLMVLMSGVSFSISFRNEAYFSYVWKRVKRLLLSVWIFLTAYFLLSYLRGYPMQLPDTETIASSYLLLSGIGYVWIIRVFLLVALIGPPIDKASRRLKGQTQYFMFLAAIYLGYELLLLASKPYLTSVAGKAFESTILYLVPYGVIFAIGFRLPQLTRHKTMSLSFVTWSVFFISAVILYISSGSIAPTQKFKYPPAVYYLSYGLSISFCLWLISDRLFEALKVLHLDRPILFVAQNSIWIYLWHIPFIEAIRLPSYLKYPSVFVLASLTTYCQLQLMTRLILPAISRRSLSRDLKMIFTG